MNDARCRRLESIYGMSVEELLSKPTVPGRDQEATSKGAGLVRGRVSATSGLLVPFPVGEIPGLR